MPRSVQRRTTWVVIVAALIPLVVSSVFALIVSSQTTVDIARERQIDEAELIAAMIERQVADIELELAVFGRTLNDTGSLRAITNDRIFPVLLSNAMLKELAIYDSNGKLIAQAFRRTPTNLPADISGEVLYQVVLGGGIYRSQPQPPRSETDVINEAFVPRLRIALPISANDVLNLVVVADIGMDHFWTQARELENTTGTRILLLNEGGQLIGASGVNDLLRANTEHLRVLTRDEPAAEYTPPQQAEVLGVRVQVQPLGWYVIVERTTAEIFRPRNDLAQTLLLGTIITLPLVALIGWLSGRNIARPIKRLYTSVQRFSEDQRSYEPVVIKGRDEIAALGNAFNTMTSGLISAQSELLGANERLEEQVQTRTAELRQTLSELETQYRAGAALQEQMRQLSMPVIPVVRQMVVMPLIGDLTKRSEEIGERLLEALQRDNARVALIDITGVPVIDESVGRSLVSAANAAHLLGAHVILAGIRPELAEVLITLDLDLSNVETTASLAQGFARGMRLLNHRIRS